MARNSADTATQRARNRRIRQETMRDGLEAQGHLSYIAEILKKVRDEQLELDQTMVHRYKIALDNHWRAVDKFLPTEKYATVAGDDDAPVNIAMRWLE